MNLKSRGAITIPIALCYLPPARANASRTVCYPGYTTEIMKAAGLCFAEIPFDNLNSGLSEIGLLITVGEFLLSPETKKGLGDWIDAGGSWISIGGICGADDLFGASAIPPDFAPFGGGCSNLGEGYVVPGKDKQLFEHLEIPLHFFNGIPVRPADCAVLATGMDAHGRASDRCLISRKAHGKGAAWCFAADLPGSVVTIQQGRGAVTRDGFPAPDGSAPVCDEVLKSGDGGALDWYFDRQPVPGVPGLNAFLQPIADQWRELFLRIIFAAARDSQVAIPILWLYPDGASSIAHLSLDTDNNVPEQAEAMFEVLESENVKATWCTIMPGLSRQFMEKIFAAGHELAMHYDAMTDGLHWGADQFTRQWRGLVELFGGRPPVTNKNHYLRWEGDTDIWDWCVSHGIEIDQSKGASKTGEGGFNFGTCRPYFPVDFKGQTIDCLELPTTTQVLTVFAPPPLADSLIKAVTRHHGILHLLFHPAHIDKPAVPPAIREVVGKARAAGMEWWTCDNINKWERARRSTSWGKYNCNGDSPSVEITATQLLEKATLLWYLPDFEPEPHSATSRAYWGQQFHIETINLEPGKSHTFQCISSNKG